VVEFKNCFEDVNSGELERITDCTTEEIEWWIDRFGKGQEIFNRLHNFSILTPICFALAYEDEPKVTTYSCGMQRVIVTFDSLKNNITTRRKYLRGNHSFRITNPHLTRMSVCTTPNDMPVITGIEEQAHSYFHLIVEPTLQPKMISYTKRYDGSDTSEEFAFQSIVEAVFRTPGLHIDPLPSNFSQLYSPS
jgi:hypothetical protein